MLSLTRPTTPRIARFLASQEDAPFSYVEIGATRGTPPPRYTVDHNRARLGYPLARALQRRFARASKRAMVEAASHVSAVAASG